MPPVGLRGAALAAWLLVPPARCAGPEEVSSPDSLMTSLKTNPTLVYNHPDYDSSGITTVKIGLRIKHLFDVSSKTMTYRLTGLLQEKWQDNRLIFDNSTTLDFDHLEWRDGDIWTPTTYFQDAVETSTSLQFLQSTSTGEVRLERLVHLHMFCPMTFQHYPFDKQICDMRTMPLKAGATSVRLEFLKPAITGLQDLELGEWTNFRTELSAGVTDKLLFDRDVQWPYAQFTFEMERIASSSVLTSILPSALITIMSYSGYWINAAAAPGRIALAIICVLATVSHRVSVLAQLPIVSYQIWIDKYLTVNLIFTFVAVVSYAIVNFGLQHRSAEHHLAHHAQFLAEVEARKKHDLESPPDREVDGQVLGQPSLEREDSNFKEEPGEDGGDPDAQSQSETSVPSTPRDASKRTCSQRSSQRPTAAAADPAGCEAAEGAQGGKPREPLWRGLSQPKLSHLCYLDHVMRVCVPIVYVMINIVLFTSK